MNSKKKILIVGGTGFIGYHLAKKCLKKGWKVTSIASRKPREKRYLPKVKYINSDITKKKALKRSITNYYNYVVNLGGYVDHSNKKKTYQSHYIGCKNLTEIFLNKVPDSFIQIGSSMEYGLRRSPQKENARCKPKSVYGHAKLLSTLHLINLFKNKNFPSTVLRFYQVYGPAQDFNRFIPIVISGCLKNKKFPCSKGNQSRDFLHVNDAVDAIFQSLKSKKAKGEVINIGSGKPKKIKNIIQYIKFLVKSGHPLFGKIKLRKEETLKIYPNINKAKKIINWRSKILLTKGIKSTIKFYNE